MIRTQMIFAAALIVGMSACLALAQSPRIYVARQVSDVASGQGDVRRVEVTQGGDDFLLERRTASNKPIIVPPVPQPRPASKYVVLQRATTTVVLNINKRYDNLDESHTWRKAVRLARTRATQPKVRLFRRHDAQQAAQAQAPMPKPRAVIRIHPGPAPKRHQMNLPDPAEQQENDKPRIKVIDLPQFQIAATKWRDRPGSWPDLPR